MNSNIPNGSKVPFSTSNELTSRFVEVPTKVNVPPKIAAYDSGINTFDGLTSNFCATLIVIGINTATIAVLLTKADAIAIAKRYTISPNIFDLEPIFIIRNTRYSNTPDFCKE